MLFRSLPVGAGLRARISRAAAVAGISLGVVVGLGVAIGVGVGWVHGLSVPATFDTVLSPPTVLGNCLDWLVATLLPGPGWGRFGVDALRHLAAVATVVVLLALGVRTPTGDRVAALRALAIALIALVALSPVVHPWYLLWPLPFVAYAIVHVVWITPVPWLGRRDLSLWVQMAVVFWVALNGLPSRATRRWVFYTLVAVAFVGVLIGCHQVFVEPGWRIAGPARPGEQVGRATGPFSVANSFAGLLILMWLLRARGHNFRAHESVVGQIGAIGAGGFVLDEHAQVLDGDFAQAQDVVLEARAQAHAGFELGVGHAPFASRFGTGERARTEQPVADLVCREGLTGSRRGVRHGGTGIRGTDLVPDTATWPSAARDHRLTVGPE